jgi:hypothetical protein
MERWRRNPCRVYRLAATLTARQRNDWKVIATCPSCSTTAINPYGRHHQRVEVAAEGGSMGNAGQPPSSWKSLSLQQSQRSKRRINNANTNGSSNNNNNMPPVPGAEPQDMLGRHEQDILNKIILQTETETRQRTINSWSDSCSKLGKRGGIAGLKNWSGRGLWEGLRIRQQEHKEWRRCSLPVAPVTVMINLPCCRCDRMKRKRGLSAAPPSSVTTTSTVSQNERGAFRPSRPTGSASIWQSSELQGRADTKTARASRGRNSKAYGSRLRLADGIELRFCLAAGLATHQCWKHSPVDQAMAALVLPAVSNARCQSRATLAHQDMSVPTLYANDMAGQCAAFANFPLGRPTRLGLFSLLLAEMP